SVPVRKLLSSDARNKAAFATSSGLPSRPIGIMVSRPERACSTCSFVSPTLFQNGVLIGPGLTALTRILRSLSSTAQVRANDRTAALVALYTVGPAIPL